MREAIDQVLSHTIDWEAVARAVRTMSSTGDPQVGVSSDMTTTARNKKSTTLTANVDNRLSDFEKFDWD